MSARELRKRCRDLEYEMSIRNQFVVEFLPSVPNRMKKTRWNFDQLNLENQQIKKMALRAFDPVNSFAPIVNYDDDQYSEPIRIKPTITAPHRAKVAYANNYRKKSSSSDFDRYTNSIKNQSVQQVDLAKDNSNSYYSKIRERIKERGNSVSGKSYGSLSNMDSTIEQFVDRIDEFKRW